MTSALSWLVTSCALFVLAATVSVVSPTPRVSVQGGHGLASVASVLALIAGIIGLSGDASQMGLFSTPVFGQVGLRMDALSAVFVVVIAVVSLSVSIYAPRYVLFYTKGRGASALSALFSLFVASLLLVVTVDNTFGFLLAWEAMSLLSYFFVVYNHRKAENVEAGYLYLVMTHLGTAFITVALLVLGASAGSFNFSQLGSDASGIDPLAKDAVFLLALIGFGTKAGIIPLHLWLPLAHPVAPSHVSALMSGVMIKTAIYGLARIVFDVLGAAHMWWGIALLAVGAVSAVLGVMYALMEHDLKRLLAFHSVENIGIILLGLGAAALFLPLGMAAAATLALVAGLLHVANHALFKSLLFLGAGAVINGAGTRDIESLGGLAKRMPATSLLFLLGSAAIAAMPPLNGFVSEWLTLQSLVAGVSASDLTARLAVPAAAAALALTGGFAAACFVKAYGIGFLGRPRSEGAAKAREVPATMIAGMVILVACCVLIGLFPGVGVRLVGSAATLLAATSPKALVTSQVTLASMSAGSLPEFVTAAGPLGNLAASGSIEVSPLPGRTGISPLFVAVLLVIGASVITKLASRRRAQRRDDTRGEVVPPWACGLPELSPQMQYSATAFTKPLRTIFRGIYQPVHEITFKCASNEQRYFVQGVRYHAKLRPLYENLLYRPISRSFMAMGRAAAKMQTGNVRTYLGYIFGALVVLLLVAR